MEKQLYGIKETKEFIKFGLELGQAFDLALQDGKFGLEDIPFFFKAFLSAGDAFSGITQVPKELADLSPQEMQELKDYIEVEFDIENDKLEEVIKKSLAIALDIYGIILVFKGGVFKK